MAKRQSGNTKPKPLKKYNIDQQIKLLPRGLSVESIIEHLKKYGVTYDDFYRDRRIPLGSDKSIAADRLMIYAQVFECSIDDLTNNRVKATSIREAFDPKSDFSIRKRSRLK